MEIATLLFFLLVIAIGCIVVILNREVFMWNFYTEKKLNTFIFDFQKKGKLCYGRITYPTKKDFQKYNVTGSDSNFIFEKRFYRVIICKDSSEEERVLVLVINNVFITRLKILNDR